MSIVCQIDTKSLAATVNLLASVAQRIGKQAQGYTECKMAIYRGHDILHSVYNNMYISMDDIDEWSSDAAAALELANPLPADDRALIVPTYSDDEVATIEVEEAS